MANVICTHIRPIGRNSDYCNVRSGNFKHLYTNMDIEFEIASTIQCATPHILADLLKEPSGCFENFCKIQK
ncbi:hypothetical protein Avbf_10359 [Armadillidium vulgare]|nr:hypothetical protein Avbf_10359 [Armadillidium vulgare]